MGVTLPPMRPYCTHKTFYLSSSLYSSKFLVQELISILVVSLVSKFKFVTQKSDSIFVLVHLISILSKFLMHEVSSFFLYNFVDFEASFHYSPSAFLNLSSFPFFSFPPLSLSSYIDCPFLHLSLPLLSSKVVLS